VHILITDDKGKNHVVRKQSISRVTSTIGGKTVVRFCNKKENLPIFVKETVKGFYYKYLKKKP